MLLDIKTNRHVYSVFPIAVIVLILSIYFPLISLFLIAALILSYKGIGCKYDVNLSIIIFSMIFATINVFKVPQSDLLNYTNYYNLMSNSSIHDALNLNYLNIRHSEVLFKSYVWILSHISEYSWSFVFVSTIIIYFVITYFSLNFCGFYINDFKYNNSSTLLFCIIWCCFIGITFSITAHVTRQYLGIAVFLIGVLFLLHKKRLFGSITVILACSFHNSVFLLLILLLFSICFSKYLVKIPIILSCLLIAYSLSGHLTLFQSYAPNIIGRGNLARGSFVNKNDNLKRRIHRSKLINH